MNIKEALLWATKELKECCQRPAYEAGLLLAFALQKERIYLITHQDDEVPSLEILQRYKKYIYQRANHEPYEYIVGRVSFYDVDLKVQKGVLIPRPETEILVDIVAKIIEKEDISSMVEIGVGSGAISVVLARMFPNLKVVATDISDMPLKVARENIETFGLKKQITLLKSNLIDKVSEPLELVVSNPPYIAEDFLLKSNVVDYEPKEALFGGRVGDELLKQIILDVKAKRGKYLACEMGYDQKVAISTFVKDVGVKSIQFYKDLAGLDRGFVIEF